MLGVVFAVHCCSLYFSTRLIVFFFKRKTAYEMRISDWSSDVCSSDLVGVDGVGEAALLAHLLDQARGEAATAEDVVHDIGGVVVWIVARDAFLAARHHRLWDRLGDHSRLALVLPLRLADPGGTGLFRAHLDGVVEPLADRVPA